jgi:signal transduction histidine kinase
MRGSFLRLVAVSVVAAWAASFVVLVSYSRTLSWTDERAKTDGVFLVHQLLDTLPAERRARRLDELRPHFGVDLAVIATSEVERRVGRAVQRGEAIPHRVSPREEWYFLVFDDGSSALAAGPVNPTRPTGYIPVGAILAVLGLPLIAGFVAVRVERQVRKVERAGEALATGELSARVDNPGGPSSELAAAFNAMAERVERLVRSRDELVQAVSHELGSPLSRLRFHMELLRTEEEAGRDQRLDAIARDLDALDALVEELLGYVQSDEVELDRREFDPSQTIADLVELARLEGTEERTFEVELPDGVVVYADRRLFQRAVENVLRNAAQHSRGRVRLELETAGDSIRASVHDDGPGIPEELREKVLTPFFRVQPDRGRKTGGVGLGLAIVSRIARQHGGDIEIGTSPLGGAVLTTVWPTRAAAGG